MSIDNRPINPVAISPTAVESRFLSRVYGWMTAGLLITAGVAAYTAQSEALAGFVLGNKIVFYGLLLAELGLVAWLSGLVSGLSARTAATVFVVYSALNGLTLSVIFLRYTAASIGTTFVVSAGAFGALSLYGLATKRSLSGVGSFCFMGLIGVVLAGLVNLFVKSSMVEFVITCVGLIVFAGLTAYDTRRLKLMGAELDADSEDGRRGSVQGALSLYLDFVNLFLLLLRFLGNRR